jgi:hypothetical protein
MRNAATAKVAGCKASKRWRSKKQECARERSWKRPPNKRPTACIDLVMRIRKLRWVGLEEKAEQLEKELEQCVVTDRVVPIQNDTDYN